MAVLPDYLQTQPRNQSFGLVATVLLYLMLISGISPAHTFISGFEHFPYGFLLVLVRGRGNMPAFFVYFVILNYFFLSILYFGQGVSEAAVSNLIQMLNFTAPLFFLRGNEAIIAKAAKHVFWAYIFIGCLQILHILSPIEGIVQLFIARFSGDPIGGYRGVTMLETEPARAGFQLLMLYIVITLTQVKSSMVLPVVLVVAQFVMIASTTGIILTMLYFAFVSAPRLARSPSTAIGLVMVITAIINVGPQHPKISLLMEYFDHYGVQGAYTAMAAISGGRFLGTVQGISNIIASPLGSGANPEYLSGVKIEVDEFQIQGYLTRVSPRPLSAILNYIFFLGLPMIAPLWFAMRRNIGKSKLTLSGVALMLIGVVYSPPGNELWIIALCLSLRKPQTARVNAPRPVAKVAAHNVLATNKRPTFG